MGSFLIDEDDFLPSFSEEIAQYENLGSAETVAGLLEAEHVHAKVEPIGIAVGIPSGYRVLVDPRQLHRARWILGPSEFTDAELNFLATGKLRNDSD